MSFVAVLSNRDSDSVDLVPKYPYYPVAGRLLKFDLWRADNVQLDVSTLKATKLLDVAALTTELAFQFTNKTDTTPDSHDPAVLVAERDASSFPGCDLGCLHFLTCDGVQYRVCLLPDAIWDEFVTRVS